jgi:hypothetical protein
MPSQTSAEDVLEPAILSATLPAKALTRATLDALNLRFQPGREPRPDKDGLVRVELGKVEWTWDTDTIEAFDQDGDSVNLETQKGYSIDHSDIQALGREAYQRAQTLKALAIPFDMQWNNPLEQEEPSSLRARLDPAAPGAYAVSAKEPEPPSARELTEWICDARSLEELREWVDERADQCVALKDQVALFEQTLGAPGREAFMDATAKLLDWASRSRLWFSGPTAWRPECESWLATLDADGLSPLERLSRHGLPITLPFVAELARLACAAQPPSLNVCAQALNAYVADECRPKSKAPSVHLKTAELFADCVEAVPEIASMLSAATRGHLSLNLDDSGSGSLSGTALARLETRWLRLQSALARPKAAQSSQGQRL